MNSPSALRTSNRGNRRRFSAGALVPPTALLVSGLLVGGALGCSDPLGPEQSELERARGRWESREPVVYEFRFQRGCFCPPEIIRPVRITVSNGVVVSAVDPDTNEPIVPPLNGFPTIDDLFDEVQDAIDREADQIDASYDATLGYPLQVFIDWITNAIDDEMSFQVSEYVDAFPALQVAAARD